MRHVSNSDFKKQNPDFLNSWKFRIAICNSYYIIHLVFQRVFWSVKIRVSTFGFKTDVENPRIEKLTFWFNLTGLFIAEKSGKNNNQTRLIDWQQKEYLCIFSSSAVMWGNIFRKLHLFPIWWQWNWSMQDKNLSMQWQYLSIKVGLFHFCHYWTRNYDYYRVCD